MKDWNTSVFGRLFGPILVIGLTATGAQSFAQDANAAAKLETAGELIVSLDARDASAGTTNWVNAGSMGNFTRVGAPKVGKMGGQAAVQFNGASDAFRSEKATPSTITGAHARSIEVWVNNPDLDSTEESMVAWGHRGADRANLSFNYGSAAAWSAVTHYGNDMDMAWGDEPPAPGKWHYLVYTYNGKTAKVYDNGAERASLDVELVTGADNRMDIGAENSAQGQPLFQSEFDGDGWGLSLSGGIAMVRVESGALTPEQIKKNFGAEKARFGVAGQ